MTTQYKQYIYKNGEWRLLGGGDSNTTTGVTSVATGSENGKIAVTTNGTTSQVSVYGLSSAAYKTVDTSIAAGSTSTNLPTSAAVVQLVSSQWKANSATSEGYVASGSNQVNKVWKTNADGVPAWRDDAQGVTSVATGTGLTGGTITGTGTIKVKLDSETSLGTIGTTSKLYAIGVDADGKLCVSVPWANDNTWKANSSSSEGYVASGANQANKVWKTDGNGVPAWRDDANTNTTYSLSNALSSHKFTSTLTAGGSGSGTSIATMEFVAGTGISLTDDTTNKKITITNTVSNTWKANTSSSEGYVASGSGQSNKVWKTDSDGVPAWRDDADTHHQAKLITTNSSTSTTQTTSALTNGNVYLNIVENSTKRSSQKISGAGDIAVTTDASGNIVITGTGNGVASIGTADGITGGTITTSGTIKANLRSYTKLTNDSAAATETSGRVYPVALDKTGYLAINVPWTDTTYTVATGTENGKIKITPSSGSAYEVSVYGLGSNAYTSTAYIPTSQKGVANGVAPLNSSSKIDATYLPSYVDDIIETYTRSGATALSSSWLSTTSGGSALTPETGKIYVVIDTSSYKNRIYRWSGSAYVDVSADTNTTYTFVDGTTGDFTVTPSGGTAQTVSIGKPATAGTADAAPWTGISGKPTTLSGYGITDAKIASGVITLGSNTITPLTSHQTVSNKSATLSWGSAVTIATVGSTNITATLPSNPNTWKANSSSSEGYVASGSGQANKVWKTNANGEPAWRDDANTTYSTATSDTLGLVKIGYTASGKNYPVQLSNGQMYVNVPWTDNNDNTWKANTASSEGYVASGSGQANKVWKTNADGTPAWRDDADTHHQAKLITTNSSTSTTQTTSALTNGNVYLNLVENSTARSGHKISGSGATSVATDASGNIIISSTDNNTNTTYTLSNALASHKFTSTLTAGGSGSGTSTATIELAAGTGMSLTDDTTNKKITINHSNSVTAQTTQGLYPIKIDAQGHISAYGTAVANNVTGSGTSGYLTKWNGTNTITNGPQLGSSTTTFLNNSGSWTSPITISYSAGVLTFTTPA